MAAPADVAEKHRAAANEPYRSAYAVDILTGITANVTIDETALATLPWAATHTLEDQSLRDDIAKRAGRVGGIG